MHTPLPAPGTVVHLRQRAWLVRAHTAPPAPWQSGLVQLSCLDDDAAGEQLEVLWDHELDARVEPDVPALIQPGAQLDPPRLFGAWLNALRWNTVTSTDKRLLQAPFRAGIDLKPYQLEPLRKALELPRVNLFIADDVGLGKTIEAGLVAQELVLRQRIDRILIICPPAVTLQWQEEMDQRFGLPFAVYNRELVSARRRERGFGVNPWTTRSRFIVSYALLRGTRGRGGTRHLELLLQALGDKAPRTLLILDECHQVAPSSGGLYPIDSRTTRCIRQVAERMEHRLFLSATPHNGHSHSFASLLHLLDPQRFTRGVPITSAKDLAPVMVRRLKRHLREHVSGLPERQLIDHTIKLEDDSPEVILGNLLERYDTLYRACLAELPKKERAARALVIINLHKRLLSSIPAFHHTLEAHARGAGRTLEGGKQVRLPISRTDGDASEEDVDTSEDVHATEASFDAGAQARALLDQMRNVAADARHGPDARLRALADWINTNLCPKGAFNERRLVIFTEYEHTLSWMARELPALLGAPCDTPHGDRIARFTGRLSDDNREQLKSAFNRPPDAHPLRILLCTDAAREGINLQAHCADLFHFDLPWNPSRIEQRNGRIDRVLQPEPVVRCHYFDRINLPEDKVLTYLVRKLHRIREELGSLSGVISDALARRMDDGIRAIDPDELDALTTPDDAALTAQRELEGDGANLLRGDLDVLTRQLERSQRRLDYRWEHLAELVDLGLNAVAGAGLIGPHDTEPKTWTLPELDPSWSGIIDPMRLPDTEPVGRWGRRGPKPDVRPVAFRAAHRLDAPAVQLHLGHPLVQRLVARFRAQGVARHDLSRVTLLENTRDHSHRVVAFARISMFGHGATRLHEQLVTVAARVGSTELEPFGDAGEQTTLERLGELLANAPEVHPSRPAHIAVRQRCSADYAFLWTILEARAEEAKAAAAAKLTDRGEQEAEAMRVLLERQRSGIHARFDANKQLGLALSRATKDEKDQFDRDRRFMDARLEAIEDELVAEPAAIRRGYELVLTRTQPVGLAYIWPAS